MSRLNDRSRSAELATIGSNANSTAAAARTATIDRRRMRSRNELLEARPAKKAGKGRWVPSNLDRRAGSVKSLSSTRKPLGWLSLRERDAFAARKPIILYGG